MLLHAKAFELWRVMLIDPLSVYCHGVQLKVSLVDFVYWGKVL
ncbi:hypothetical protein BVRB_5g117410 [Beta vulgaris subsp. vulgaris]|nr:hypothetical protein BVRB_5g117410 [Beta vulgaris subsp. vulgaris]